MKFDRAATSIRRSQSGSPAASAPHIQADVDFRPGELQSTNDKAHQGSNNLALIDVLHPVADSISQPIQESGDRDRRLVWGDR